ncbi:alpha/beta hydrolase [Saccharomonospora sp. NPDC006951]
MPEIIVEAIRIPYRVEGSGPALVLVHGTGPGSGMWDPLLPVLAERYTVVLPDLSGSDVVDDVGELSVELLAGQVIAVIEDAGVGQAHVLGFSLGAPVALAVAATRPDLVGKVIAVAGWGHSEGDEYLRLMMTTWQDLAERAPTGFGRFATLTAFSRGHLNAIGRDAVEENTKYLRPTASTLRQIELNLAIDIRHLLPTITAPALIVGCALDATVPCGNSRELHAAIPGSGYAELEAGHVVMMERPAEFTTLVTEFLS